MQKPVKQRKRGNIMSERACSFIRMNERERKPRARGITEIRGPYYTPMGKRYLEDVLETMGTYVDSLKFAGGSFALMPRERLRELIELCHRHRVLVSTGGFIEHVLTQGADAVTQIVDGLGLDKVMFEAADPAVFSWYVKHYGPDVNLFIDHSQIVQLEALRSGVWGTKSLWGRVVTYKG